MLEPGTPIVIDQDTVTVEIYKDGDGLKLRVMTFAAVDRHYVFAWKKSSDTPHQRKLLERLKLAILEGKVFTNAVVATDTNGKTYIASNHEVWRNINADLKKLGY